MHDERVLKWYDRVGKARPEHLPHGVKDDVENPLSEQLKRAKCWNWRIDGNLLLADTEFGPLSQRIPTDYICKGTDEDGMPILVKINPK